MTVPVVLDPAGPRRSPATLPGYHAGRPPRNKGQRYRRPANRRGDRRRHAPCRGAPPRWRLRGLIVVLWRAGLRIHEALALTENDLDPSRGSLLVRSGKGGSRRELGMDEWAWEQLRHGSQRASNCPPGRCSASSPGPPADGPGRAPRPPELRRVASQAGVRRRFAPHQLRHAHALELAREGVPLNVIQRQLGQTNLGTTSIYLQGIDNPRDHRRRPHPPRPDVSASAGLRL